MIASDKKSIQDRHMTRYGYAEIPQVLRSYDIGMALAISTHS